jgi:hypothetical protein
MEKSPVTITVPGLGQNGPEMQCITRDRLHFLAKGCN